MENVREHVDTCSSIRQILNSYNLGPGLLRELLQNSDDSGATHQRFIFDTREYGVRTLVDPTLSATQGAALVAINNSKFSEKDWAALLSIGDSSKGDDESKTGKYGLGFRACYHVTDYPHILSGNTLMILDPQQTFADDYKGGYKMNTKANLRRYPDQAAPFRAVEASIADSFNGTIIRLPLRSVKQAASSRVSKRRCTPSDIRELFDAFKKEIGIELLFLKSILSIELAVASNSGTKVFCKVGLSPADARRNPRLNHHDLYHTTFEITTSLEVGHTATSRWHLVHFSLSDEETARRLESQVGHDVRLELKDNKMSGHVTVAIPEAGTVDGRLFTLLPLPIFTRFPVHINATLALMSDRQHLKSAGDEVVDKLHIEWNKLIFESLAPAAYARLIDAVTSANSGLSILNMLPPAIENPTNDQNYWSNTLSAVVEKVVTEDYPVWPVRGSSGDSPSYRSLREVIVPDPKAPPSADLLKSLVLVGIPLCHVPRVVYDLLGRRVRTLSPAVLYGELVHAPHNLDPLTRESRLLLLEYLLSAAHLPHIHDLPLIPLLNGGFTSFNPSTNSFILVSERQGALFSGCDQRLASIEKRTIVRPLQQLASQVFLSPDHVIGFARAKGAPEIRWLIDFWTWLSTWPRTTPRIIAELGGLALLPGRGNIRHKVEVGVVDVKGLSDARVDALVSFGIPVIHKDFSVPSGGLLSTSKLIRQPSDFDYFFAHVRVPPSPVAPTVCEEMRGHIAQFFAAAQLDSVTNQALRSLPIFSTIDPQTMHRSLTPIQGRCLFVDPSQTGVLPIVRGVEYIDMSNQTGRVIAGLLGNESGSADSEVSIMQLAVENLESQPPALMDRLLLRILTRFEDMPLASRDGLRKSLCVPVGDGKDRRRPLDVIDPGSKLAQLFTASPHHLPSTKCLPQVLILLKRLGLLQDSLTQEILNEAIASLSGNRQRALTLLDLLDEHFASGRLQLTLSPTEPWIPVPNFFVRARECRDQHESFLFDRVLAVVPRRFKSTDLRLAFGWSNPVPLDTVISQLRILISSRDSHAFVPVIRHLALRTLSDEDIASLKEELTQREWIPTVDEDTLASAGFAVFEAVPPGLPFKRVHSGLLTQATKQFLSRMGCLARPSNQAVLLHISELGRLPKPDAEFAVRLLELLSASELSPGQWQQLLLPNAAGYLHPPSQLYVHDMGPSYQSWTPSDRAAAYRRVPEALCREVPFLSVILAEQNIDVGDDDDDEQMAEDLAERISGVLRAYGVESASNEIIANACDAGASAVEMLLDERQFLKEDLLSEHAGVCQGPALLFYNDATFSASDFKGMLRVGQGGKRGDGQSIGRFGLGALSYFHFTDVAMVLSGDFVLFLDPSKSHLPKRSSAFKRRLSVMQQHYPGHLKPFDGLFGFKTHMNRFEGTIIRLPLRQIASSISSTIFNVGIISALLEKAYFSLAKSSFFFTRLSTIRASCCNSSGLQRSLWDVSVTRNPSHHEGAFESHDMRMDISSKAPEIWLVARYAPGKGPVPRRFHELLETAKLASPSVGVAVRLPHPTLPDPSDAIPTNHVLFSTLPLPEEVQLPMHLHGTFVLAPDRRNIRFNKVNADKGSTEEEFNKWIVEKLAPQVYLFAIEQIVHSPHMNTVDHDYSSMWPHSPSSSGPISVSRTLANALYTAYLPNCPRNIFRGLGGALQTVQGSLFSLSEPAEVLRLLISLHVPNLVQGFQGRLLEHRLEGHTVTAVTLRSCLSNSSSEAQELFETNLLSVSDVDCIIRFLQAGRQSLVGLAVMPLRDRSLGIFPDSDEPIIFVHPSSDIPPTLFPPSRFLSDQLNRETVQRLIDDHTISIRQLNKQGFVELISLRLPKRQEIPSNEVDDEWNSLLFSTAPLLSVGGDDLKAFPLIPTHNGGCVSLEYCLSQPVLLLETRNIVSDALVKCGAVIIRKPPLFRSQLAAGEGRDLTLPSVLRFLATVRRQRPHPFYSLSPEEHKEVAGWLRNQIKRCNQSEIDTQSQTVLALPIWEAVTSGGPLRMLAANEVEMLPAGLSSYDSLDKLSMFLDRDQAFALRSQALQKVLKQSSRNFDAQWLLQRITLPPQLRPAEIPRFVEFLGTVLPLGYANAPAYRLPNVNGTLVPASSLYSPAILLFSSAFRRRQPPPFPHHTLSGVVAIEFHIQHRLHVDNFFECARVVDEEVRRGVDGETLDMATDVFTHYSDNLPVELASNAVGWTRFNRLRFVPRAVGRDISSFTVDQYWGRLPLIVSPSQICRPEYASISWTQRATSLVPPSERLRMVYADFGVPTVQEVVEHLIVLATEVALAHSHSSLLLSDLNATYKWLNERSDEAGAHLRQHSDRPLFLNVDQPKIEQWKWQSAKCLMLNLTYDDEAKGIFSVRIYLAQFSSLLRAINVREIKHAELPSNRNTENSATVSETIRKRFNAMRLDEKTDMIIIAADGSQYPAHRFFLAAAVPYFDYLLGGWKEELEKTSSMQFSGLALKLLLDFIYTGDFQVKKPAQDAFKEVVDLVNVMLELLGGGHRMDIPSLQVKVTRSLVMDLELVQPETLERISDAAKLYSATDLVEACSKYERENAHLLELLD